MTRVTSACNASTCRSNISFTCSSQSSGHAGRAFEIGQQRFGSLLLRLLDPAFDFSNGIHIFRHPVAVRRAQLFLKASHILRHPVQDALVLPKLGPTFLRRASIAKQPFEDQPRIRF